MSNSQTNYRKLYIYLLSANAALGFGYWSYNLSIFNSLQVYIQNYVFPEASTTLISLIASFLSAGAILGAILAIPLMSKWNRRTTMMGADVVGIIGLILTIISSLPSVLIGRFISGMVGGLNTVVIPVYLVEMSPVPMCGGTGSLSIIILELFAFVSLALSFGVPEAPDGTIKDQAWRILFFVPAVFNIVRFILLKFVFIFETPFVYVQNEKERSASAALAKIFKSGIDKELKRVRDDVLASSIEGSVKIRDLLKKKYRKSFFISFVVALMQQLCGMPAVFIFSNDIFGKSTTNPALFSTLLGVINFISVIVSFYIIDKVGRRPLLITGNILIGILWLAFGLISKINGEDDPSLKILLLVWPILFQMSLGSLTFLYISEALPSIGVACCVTVNWTAGFLVAQFYLSVVEHLGFPTPFLFFSACSLLTGGIFWNGMVETKGKTKSEIIDIYTYGLENYRLKKAASNVSEGPIETIQTER